MAKKSGKQRGQQSSGSPDVTSRAESRRAQRVQAQQRDKRNRLLKMLGGVGVVALLVAGLLALSNWDREGQYAGEDITAPPSIAAEIPRDGRLLGDPDAPVHVVIYSDFQCPGCAAWTRSVKPQLINNHVATGEVLFEYRDLTGLGSESHDASVGAACALEQGKFWEYHDMLLHNQVGRDNGGFAKSRMIRMAEEVGLDMDAFEDCLGTDRFDNDLEAMENMAISDGVQATPTLLVNGVAMTAPTYDQLRQQIQTALATGS